MFFFSFLDGDLKGYCSATLPCSAPNTECDITILSGRCKCIQGYSEYDGQCFRGK